MITFSKKLRPLSLRSQVYLDVGGKESVFSVNTAECKKSTNSEQRQVVLPVDWGQISIYTFEWYINHIHKPENCVHICHVPDFKSKVSAGMDQKAVYEVMKELNIVSSELKRLYESLIEEYQIVGKFVRVGGNNRWSAICEYSRRVKAAMIVMGTQTLTPEVSERKSASNLVSSITYDVLMHSVLPIIVVRMPGTGGQLTVEEKEIVWKQKVSIKPTDRESNASI